MSLRLAACLLLLCICLPATAREMRLAGANGDGGSCPELISAGIEETQAGRSGKPAASAIAREKVPGSRSAEAENVVRPPRWHSFLPGMFR